MQWPHLSEVEKLVPLPEGCHGTRLRRSEIPLLIKSIREWYPDVAVGGASCYLTTDFYENEATLEGEEDKSLFVVMIWKGDQCGRRCKSEPPRRPNSEPGMEAGSGCLPAVDEFSLTA